MPWHHEGLTKTALGTADGPQERLVRVLLGSEPEDLGVMPITGAYELAEKLGLDLQDDEASGTVRLDDYGKMVYERDVGQAPS